VSGRRTTARTRLTLAEPSLRAVVGLRGFVMLGILLFDAGITGAGVVNVELFLLLLGFSVTRSLLTEHHARGTVSLVRFYLGRLKPLVPLLALTIGLSLVAVLRFGTYDELDRFASQSIASMLLLNNWEEIGADAVYSETFDRISPLGHLWVIAVTEQFFRAWPLMIVAVLTLGRLLSRRFARRAGRHSWQWSPISASLVLVLSLAGAAASAVAMRSGFASTDAERTYLGTDTHLVGLFAGAAAASVHYVVVQRRSRRRLKHVIARSALIARLSRLSRSLLVSLASGASLIGLAVLWAQTTSYSPPWLYAYGFALIAVLGAVLVLSLTSPVNQVSRFFLFSPFVGLGNVAYTVFIVHLPIFWLVLKLAPAASSWDVLVVGIPAALLLGSGIHHLVAEPLRQRRWNPQGLVIIASLVVATTAALWFLPATRLAAPAGNGDIAVLALGDSRANNLSAALDFAEQEDADDPAGRDPFRVTRAGVRGCGIADASRYRSATGRESPVPAACRTWEEQWTKAVQAAQPNIILIDVSHDAMSRRVDGAWTDLTDPAAAARYRESLATLAEVTTRARTSVVIANARLHTGDATPEQAAAFNALLDEFAAAHPQITVLDLQGEVCTDAACTPTTRLGQGMYTDDRVHFSDAGKKQIAPWLSAQLLAAYRGTTNTATAP
jgi:peptidoglycan/LPS O-acetylase OafA/YrhL/lysophospholipase L1-like esterase